MDLHQAHEEVALGVVSLALWAELVEVALVILPSSIDNVEWIAGEVVDGGGRALVARFLAHGRERTPEKVTNLIDRQRTTSTDHHQKLTQYHRRSPPKHMAFNIKIRNVSQFKISRSDEISDLFGSWILKVGEGNF